MIRIALYADSVSVLRELQTLLERYRTSRRQAVEYITFRSPLDLLGEIEKGSIFDILFLDVLMPGHAGINVAAEVRNLDSNVKIIFLTPSAEFAVQSYMAGAYFYQVKPIREESFFRLMDSAVTACRKERQTCLILQCKSRITRIELGQLEYCEVATRTLFLHLTDGTVLEKSGSLDVLHEQLAEFGCFYRPHRSYLINLDHVQSLSYRCMVMDCGAEIPLPRGKYQTIKDTYLQHMENRGHIMV